MTCTRQFKLPADLFDLVETDPNMEWIVDNLLTIFHQDTIEHKKEKILVTGAWAVRPYPGIEIFPKYLDKDLMEQYTSCKFANPEIEIFIEMDWVEIDTENGKRYFINKNLFDISISIADGSEEDADVQIMYEVVDKKYLREFVRYLVSRRAEFTFEFNSSQ